MLLHHRLDCNMLESLNENKLNKLTNYWLFFIHYHFFPERAADATDESLLGEPEYEEAHELLRV